MSYLKYRTYSRRKTRDFRYILYIRTQSTMIAYIRGLFSWLLVGWEVMERLGRHRASLAKPYLVMAAYKSALDCSPLQLSRIHFFNQVVPETWNRRVHFDILRQTCWCLAFATIVYDDLDYSSYDGDSSLERVNNHSTRFFDALSQDVTERHNRIVSISGLYVSGRLFKMTLSENNDCGVYRQGTLSLFLLLCIIISSMNCLADK